MNLNPAETGSSREGLLNQRNDDATYPRSAPCNGNVVRRLRKKLGLTQAQLATRSGFSERLVRKAEASIPISMKTVKKLAVALSDDERQVQVNFLICSPIEIAKKLLASSYSNEGNPLPPIDQQTRETIRAMNAGASLPSYYSNDTGVVAFVENRLGDVISSLFLKFVFENGNLVSVKSYVSNKPA